MKGKIHHNLGYIDCIDHRALPRVRYQTLGTCLKNEDQVGNLTSQSLLSSRFPKCIKNDAYRQDFRTRKTQTYTTLIFLAFTRIISVSFGGIEREVEAPENAEKVA